MKRWLLIYSLTLLACGAGDAPPSAAEPTKVSFPDGFLWGTATAGFQIGLGLANTDWGAWAATEGKISEGDDPDDGPDALSHIAEDIGLMSAGGHSTYRFSIEMARVYPTRADFDADQTDAAGLASYDELVDGLIGAGITPMVTLHHFVWPMYMSDPAQNADPQGWERADATQVFETWCQRMGSHFGDRVDLWVSINEPTVEANVGYLATVFPPGVSNVERVVDVLKQQLEAHRLCYDALHAADKVDADGDGAAALVSISKHNRVYEPADPNDPEDAAAAEHSRRFWNQWFLDAIVRGDVDEDFDDAVDVVADPALAGRADFIGLNYYGPSRVDADGLEQPFLGVVPSQFGLPTERPKNDLDWDIHPAGFAVVLDEVATYGLPVYITENGIADSLDVNRARFVAEHLFELGKAIARGVDVRGYYHWSLMDNFEWAGGFCPRFGLYSVDFAAAEKTRTATSAVSLLKQLAETNVLAKSTIDALPAYQSRPAPCASF